MNDWNIWTVGATAAVGAIVALLVDFFVRPRLQVRNEKFLRKSKDQLALLEVVRSMLVNSAQMVDTSDQEQPVKGILEARYKKLRDRLAEQADELQGAYAGAAHAIDPALREMTVQMVGFTLGICASKSTEFEVSQILSPRLGLLCDALYTPKTKFIGYRLHIRRVKAYLSDPNGPVGEEALRPR